MYLVSNRVTTEGSPWGFWQHAALIQSGRSMSPRERVPNQVASCGICACKACASQGGMAQRQGSVAGLRGVRAPARRIGCHEAAEH